MLIAGAGGFAKELLEAVLQNNRDEKVVFYDDQTADAAKRFLDRYEVIRSTDAARSYFTSVDKRFALGVGSPAGRKKLYDLMSSIGGIATSIVSPYARVGSMSNVVGEGVVMLSNAVVESCNTIGKGVLLHVGALVSHDVTVGDFCEISPNVSLLGRVKVGSMCRIGTAATVLPDMVIGDNVTVGAGAVVTKNVEDNSLVVGIPARPVEGL